MLLPEHRPDYVGDRAASKYLSDGQWTDLPPPDIRALMRSCCRDGIDQMVSEDRIAGEHLPCLTCAKQTQGRS